MQWPRRRKPADRSACAETMTDGATAIDRADEQVGAAVQGLELLGRAARQRAIYPKGHPAAGLAIEQARTGVGRLLGEEPEAEVSLSRGRIAVNGRVLPDGASARVDLASCLRDRGISRFAIRAGIEDDELIALLDVLGSEPEALQERGGPQALLPEKDDPHLALTEIEYARYVRASEAEEATADEARVADVGGGGMLGGPLAATELLNEAGLEQLRGLLQQPQLLARHLLALAADKTGKGQGTGVGGGTGAGIGDGTGKGIGTGGDVPVTR